MKNKVIFLIVGIIVICSIIITSILIESNKNSDEIPGGYIAVFHGGGGEQTYETYIYKQNNHQKNYGFDYINVTSTTVYWGSTNLKRIITNKGSVQWTDDVFDVAKKNNAYSFVTLPNSNDTYTIEEFQEMFLMN